MEKRFYQKTWFRVTSGAIAAFAVILIIFGDDVNQPTSCEDPNFLPALQRVLQNTPQGRQGLELIRLSDARALQKSEITIYSYLLPSMNFTGVVCHGRAYFNTGINLIIFGIDNDIIFFQQIG